jgi:hypothetical protein
VCWASLNLPEKSQNIEYFEIRTAEDLILRLLMTAYTVKCSLARAETVEAVKAHIYETQNDFEKHYNDWSVKNEIELGDIKRINTARKLL